MLNLPEIFKVDSYKISHWLQFPQGMSNSEYYIESRGGLFDKVMVYGVDILAKSLERRITKIDVDTAKEIYEKHFGMDVFNYDGFMRIVNERDGRLPITIRAIPDGFVIPVKTPIAVVTAEEGFGWLVGYLETMILRAIWYPTTVASISFHARKIIQDAMEKTCCLDSDAFDSVLRTRLHDFGA